MIISIVLCTLPTWLLTSFLIHQKITRFLNFIKKTIAQFSNPDWLERRWRITSSNAERQLGKRTWRYPISILNGQTLNIYQQSADNKKKKLIGLWRKINKFSGVRIYKEHRHKLSLWKILLFFFFSPPIIRGEVSGIFTINIHTPSEKKKCIYRWSLFFRITIFFQLAWIWRRFL
jgi:hypothetical protein